MSLVARVIRQFHDGGESVRLEQTVALPFQPTMGTKLVILTDEGVTPLRTKPKAPASESPKPGKAGLEDVAVRFKGLDDPTAEWRQVWPAHEHLRVRRAQPEPPRGTPA